MREEWEARANAPGKVGLHARANLARRDRGERLPTEQPLPVQAWSFGEGLAMVFLGGEVVVDYALRLRREFDPRAALGHRLRQRRPLLYRLATGAGRGGLRGR